MESWKEERVWEHEKKDEGALLLVVDEQGPLQAPDNYACEAKEGCSFEEALIALQPLEDEFEEHQREKICALKHQNHNFMLQRSEVKAETPVQTLLRAERQVKAVAAQAGEIDDSPLWMNRLKRAAQRRFDYWQMSQKLKCYQRQLANDIRGLEKCSVVDVWPQTDTALISCWLPGAGGKMLYPLRSGITVARVEVLTRSFGTVGCG